MSTGSVSNILKEWRQQENNVQESKPSRVTTGPSEIEFKKNPDISIENHSINNKDFESNGYHLEGGPLSWFMNGYDSEQSEPETSQKLRQDKPSSSIGIGKAETVESNPPKKIYPRNPDLEYKFEKDRIAFEYYGQGTRPHNETD